MTLVGTTTKLAPLRWSQQRKLAVAGSRVISGYWKDDTTGRFSWSTGAAFTPYAADIAGWNQGSLAIARDTAGTWRILTSWIQIGNVAGRTDLSIYAMAGSLSTDLNTLSWGPAVALDANFTCAPDVALVADGAGLFGVVTYGIITGGANNFTSIRARSLRIGATGTLTLNPGIATIGGPWYGASPQLPQSSVAIDPASKNVGVLYSAGFRGPGMGSLFRRGTYSAGATVWDRPARSLDEQTIPVGSANGDRAAPTCQWDPTHNGWVMGGVYPRDASAGSTQRIWQRDAADTFTSTLVDTGTGSAAHNVANGPLLVDPVSGNILIVGGTHTSTGASGNIYIWGYSRPPAPAAVVDEGVTAVNNSTIWQDVAAVAVAGAVHVVYDDTHLTAGPWNVNYLRVGLPVAPNAPQLLAPTAGIYILVDQTQRFSTQFSSDTPGDGRSAIEIEYRPQGDTTATSTGWVGHSGGYIDFPAGTFVDAVTYEWRSRDKGATGLVGAWSGWETFIGLGAPAGLTILAPANNSSGPAVATVAWSVSDQDVFRVEVVDDAGLPTADLVGLDGSSDTGSVIEPSLRAWQITFVDSGASRHIRVYVEHVGVWSDFVSVHYTPTFVLPGLVVTTAEAQDGYVLVSVTNYAGEGDVLAPPGVDVPVRSVDFGSDFDGTY